MVTEAFGVITDSEGGEAVASAGLVEEYPDDRPYPSCLLLGLTGTGRPLHLVAAYDEGGEGLGRDRVSARSASMGRLPEEETMKCIFCHGEEISPSQVSEDIPVGPDIVHVPITVLLCGICGERYYCALRILGVPRDKDAQSAGRVREGRRPAPLGRARGEGPALAAVGASAGAFPANDPLRR
jgi:transcription elongation factor Elf1